MYLTPRTPLVHYEASPRVLPDLIQFSEFRRSIQLPPASYYIFSTDIHKPVNTLEIGFSI